MRTTFITNGVGKHTTLVLWQCMLVFSGNTGLNRRELLFKRVSDKMKEIFIISGNGKTLFFTICCTFLLLEISLVLVAALLFLLSFLLLKLVVTQGYASPSLTMSCYRSKNQVYFPYYESLKHFLFWLWIVSLLLLSTKNTIVSHILFLLYFLL